MSETTEASAPAEPAIAPATEAPEPVAAAEPTDAQPAAELAPETPAEPTPEDKKRAQGDRRFAHLTARAAADREAREKAEARAAAAEALLAAQRGDDGPKPTGNAPETVRAEAERLRAAERFNERRLAVVSDGAKEFGEAAWNEKTNVLAGLGATENPAFMQALVEIDDAPKLVAALADDADGLAALLNMPPVAMAAKMGRMAAHLATPAEAPKPKISAAPKPVTPVSGRATPAPDAYDPKLSMKEYVALRSKEAPPHLGGQRKG